MKSLLIAANWKSNKTKIEAKKWLNSFASYYVFEKNKEVVIFTPFTLLDFVKSYVKDNNLKLILGAQDISAFDSGSYTGEISSEMLREFVEYVLIGHSERRINQKEDDDTIKRKVEQALKFSIKPIVCVSEISQIFKLKEHKDIIFAYEPLFAVGSGQAEDPLKADEVARDIKEYAKNAKVIYGGSVTSSNVNFFTKKENIDGVLVGTQSLEPDSFSEVISNAA
jgi:triosephosphate isomerase (TIM)